MDPVYDQQTGQGDSDFVSVNNTPGFFIQFGQVDGVEYVAFRILLNEYKTSGNVVNIRFGFDGNMDGVADLFLGLSEQSNQYGLVFQSTGSGANNSPSTTTWGEAFYPTTHVGTLNSTGNALLIDSNNFSNIQLADGVTQVGNGANATTPASNLADYYPGWTTQSEAGKTNLDSMISYAVPLADINAALAQIGKNFTISAETFMLWIAVTATQNNAVNQDAYGINKAGFDNTYASFLPYMNGHGQPVPEPSAYGLLLGGAFGGLFLCRRRRRPAHAAERA